MVAEHSTAHPVFVPNTHLAAPANLHTHTHPGAPPPPLTLSFLNSRSTLMSPAFSAARMRSHRSELSKVLTCTHTGGGEGVGGGQWLSYRMFAG